MTEEQGKTRHFTPLYDDLVERFGLVTASVYGKILRYYWMRGETCFASQGRIASELGLSARTVRRAIRTLLEMGLIVEVGGYVKGYTHRYAPADAGDTWEKETHDSVSKCSTIVGTDCPPPDAMGPQTGLQNAEVGNSYPGDGTNVPRGMGKTYLGDGTNFPTNNTINKTIPIRQRNDTIVSRAQSARADEPSGSSDPASLSSLSSSLPEKNPAVSPDALKVRGLCKGIFGRALFEGERRAIDAAVRTHGAGRIIAEIQAALGRGAALRGWGDVERLLAGGPPASQRERFAALDEALALLEREQRLRGETNNE